MAAVLVLKPCVIFVSVCVFITAGPQSRVRARNTETPGR
jgi:hypothetical protein